MPNEMEWECDSCGDNVPGFEPDYDWQGEETGYVLSPKPLCNRCKACANGYHRQLEHIYGCCCQECTHCGRLVGGACEKCRYEDAMESAEEARRDAAFERAERARNLANDD